MKSETDLKNQVQRAQRADELLNDPLIQEFIIAVRGDLLNEFESAGLDSDKERLNTWQQAQVLKRFLSKFTKEIKKGKEARSILGALSEKVRNII